MIYDSVNVGRVYFLSKDKIAVERATSRQDIDWDMRAISFAYSRSSVEKFENAFLSCARSSALESWCWSWIVSNALCKLSVIH